MHNQRFAARRFHLFSNCSAFAEFPTPHFSNSNVLKLFQGLVPRCRFPVHTAIARQNPPPKTDCTRQWRACVAPWKRVTHSKQRHSRYLRMVVTPSGDGISEPLRLKRWMKAAEERQRLQFRRIDFFGSLKHATTRFAGLHWKTFSSVGTRAFVFEGIAADAPLKVSGAISHWLGADRRR